MRADSFGTEVEDNYYDYKDEGNANGIDSDDGNSTGDDGCDKDGDRDDAGDRMRLAMLMVAIVQTMMMTTVITEMLGVTSIPTASN